MYQWLSEAIDNDSLVITASRRLSRVLKSEYDKQQTDRGLTAWRSPDIRFLDDWLSSIVNSTPGTLPIVLNAHASTVVWERCLKAVAADQTLNFGGLVRQARQSWQRLQEWQVAVSEVSTTSRSQDEQLFATAARKYQGILADNDWIDGAQLAKLVSKIIEEGITPAPDRIVYAGFDRLVPAVEGLFSALQEAGCKLSAAKSIETGADVSVMPFDNPQAEFRAAGAWARRELEGNPDASVGIVSASLDRDSAASERLIREGLAPGWQYGSRDLRNAVNTSYGRRLSEYPAIAVALLWLEWIYRGLHFSDISILLRTQFVGGRVSSGRCKLELALRQLPDRPWTPSSIKRFCQNREMEADAVAWLKAIEALAALRSDAAGKASPAIWAEKIDGLLAGSGWPGRKTLTSDEFQLLNRWRELLNDLSGLSIVWPTMTFGDAINRLGALANEVIYQPESRDGVVLLLGPLEAAGMTFDSVWVSGLQADAWPPASHPLTMISRQLQRKYSMPDSTPDDTLEYSRRVLNRLVKSADCIRLSWPQMSEESENSASPLIAHFATSISNGAVDPGWHACELIESQVIESPVADPGPAVGKDELVAGGAYTVQRQSTEPFAAFARGRLRVADMETVSTGLSPSQRGIVIHRALHALLADEPSQEEISRWTGPDSRERIENAVASALRKYLWQADPVLRRLLELEHDRLCELLENFVAAELARKDFKVERVEHAIDYQQFGVRLELQIDRIDRLADESILIADYKTGQPKNLIKRDGDPRDLQLPVYACALEGNIGGMVLINIDSRKILYKGTGASGEWDAKGAEIWPQRLTAWKDKVGEALQQIAKGDVRINLELPTDETRPLNILSRFEERRRAY